MVDFVNFIVKVVKLDGVGSVGNTGGGFLKINVSRISSKTLSMHPNRQKQSENRIQFRIEKFSLENKFVRGLFCKIFIEKTQKNDMIRRFQNLRRERNCFVVDFGGGNFCFWFVGVGSRVRTFYHGEGDGHAR